MERTYVESSHIKAVGYNFDSAILEFEFNDGKVYQYYDVPEYVYHELLAAESKGKYAHENIYKHYNYQRIN